MDNIETCLLRAYRLTLPAPKPHIASDIIKSDWTGWTTMDSGDEVLSLEEAYDRIFSIRTRYREDTQKQRESNNNNEEKVTADYEKVAAEDEKVTAEDEKVTAEDKKITAENEKVTAEDKKVVAEDEKVRAEDEKVTAEDKKITAEKVTAEDKVRPTPIIVPQPEKKPKGPFVSKIPILIKGYKFNVKSSSAENLPNSGSTMLDALPNVENVQEIEPMTEVAANAEIPGSQLTSSSSGLSIPISQISSLSSSSSQQIGDTSVLPAARTEVAEIPGSQLTLENANSISRQSIPISQISSQQISILDVSRNLETSSEVSERTPCRYAAAGCCEKISQGELANGDHCRECQYRPIPCLFDRVCSDMVPHHNFILHNKSHFMTPVYSRVLLTQVIIVPDHFLYGDTWVPKWLSTYDHHFFLMMSHTRGRKVGVSGIWTCWIWMLGTLEEASEYYYQIEVFKDNRRISGTFTVQSIRTPLPQIETTKSCLTFNDTVVKHLANFGDTEYRDLFIDVCITKKPPLEDGMIQSYTGKYRIQDD